MTKDDIFKKIKIFDTTLRDGEQSPGASMNKEEKLIIAKQLAKLNVDVIEAGFAVSSNDDFDAIKQIATEVKGPVICSLARLIKNDIDRAWGAVMPSENPRIHVFIGTSKIHMEKKLKMSNEEIISNVKEMVSYAKSLCNDIEFSAEDASRTDFDFMIEVIRTAINSGATTINIPDTVGYAQPEEFGERIKKIFEKLNDLIIENNVTISVHCHNDLGNAVSNSLIALKYGATQVEGCINGIGERAGNSALEEIIMNIKTRQEYYNLFTDVNIKELFNTSKLVSKITGLEIQRNKAIVGKNAFAHEAGIHQHGVLADKNTYEIMDKENVGWSGDNLVIGKHSGKHAINSLLKNYGYELGNDEINQITLKVKELADCQKEVTSDDVIALANDLAIDSKTMKEIIVLKDAKIEISSNSLAKANLVLEIENKIQYVNSSGLGPVDAACNALISITSPAMKLKEYNLKAITGGTNALGDVFVIIEDNGREFKSRAVNQDIVMASIYAIIKGMNKALYERRINLNHEK